MAGRCFIIFFLLAFLMSGATAQQQNYVFNHHTSEEGLGSEFVQSVFQNSKGFYWIGTTSGLQKFDWHSFSKPLTAGKDMLSSSRVTETKDGTIWISNENSLFR